MDKDPTPAELLAKALEGMASDERTRVVAWLVNRSFSPPRPVGPEIVTGTRQATAAALTALASHETVPLFGRGSERRGEHQVVPIRLPTEQHSLLRDWCQEHNFTMATVVRGLVERFLEERGLLRRPATGQA